MSTELGQRRTRPILIVPGYRGSVPDRWQSLWEESLPRARRILRCSGEQPCRDAWVKAHDRAIRACAEPAVLVGHSLGPVTIAHQGARRVPAGACGHINAEAGFGPWPEGEAFLREFL